MSSIEKAIERLAKSKASNAKKAGSQKTAPTEPSAAVVAEHTDAPAVQATAQPKVVQPETLAAAKPVEKKPNQKITLDYDVLSSLGYVVPDSDSKQLAEEYRIIKRPVVMNAFGKGAAPIHHGNLVSIASSLPSEGKTFTALNLGLSIASEMDATVLLIDGDVLKASLSKLIGTRVSLPLRST